MSIFGDKMPVFHKIIQPIIHEDIQPVITKEIQPVILRQIQPVFFSETNPNFEKEIQRFIQSIYKQNIKKESSHTIQSETLPPIVSIDEYKIKKIESTKPHLVPPPINLGFEIQPYIIKEEKHFKKEISHE